MSDLCFSSSILPHLRYFTVLYNLIGFYGFIFGQVIAISKFTILYPYMFFTCFRYKRLYIEGIGLLIVNSVFAEKAENFNIPSILYADVCSNVTMSASKNTE